MGAKYLLDTNIFIRSKNELPMDIYESFWCAISDLANKGLFYSSVKVKEELERGMDELPQWIKDNLPKDFFVPLDSSTMIKYAEVQNWASKASFRPEALSTFADVADAYLVAAAAVHDMVLVTYEKSDPICKRRVMIPDACTAIGVKCCDLNASFRILNVKI